MKPAIIILLILATLVIINRQNINNHRTVACPHCNVIIITIDSLRGDALNCSQKQQINAPNLCTFAQNNIRFSNAYATAAWTLPSEMSLFTGLYPVSHGIFTVFTDILNAKIPTLTDMVRSYGYETFFVSNYQPQISPRQFGRSFKSVNIIQNESSEVPDQWLRTIDRIAEINKLRKPAFVYFHTDQVHDYSNLITDKTLIHDYLINQDNNIFYSRLLLFNDATAERTKTWIHNNIFDRSGRGTTLQYISWQRTLESLTNKQEIEKLFHTLPEFDQKRIIAGLINKQISAQNFRDYVGLMRLLYDESVRRTDTSLGPVLERLNNKGLLRNTIVIITSEHGELLGEKGIVGHGSALYKPVIHVPFIMHIPGITHKDLSVLTSSIDVFPTILNLLDIPQINPVAGQSLVKAISGSTYQFPRNYVVSQGINNSNNSSILTYDWHLLHVFIPPQTTPHQELYNVPIDPTEDVNVIGNNNSHAQILNNTLLEELLHQPTYQPKHTAFPDWVSDEQRQNLINTGYFD